MFASATAFRGSSPLHGLVESVPVEDLDEGAAAHQGRKARKLHLLLLSLEEIAQSGFDQFPTSFVPDWPPRA
jgi:hypothetical protein